jgi:bilirubin oxidase
MMVAFNITALSDLGYDEKTHFVDPMEPAYRNRFFSDSDFTSRSGDFCDDKIAAKIKFFNDLEAYRNKDGVESAFENYWSTKVIATSTVPLAAATTLTTVASSAPAADSSPAADTTSVAAVGTTSAPAAGSSAVSSADCCSTSGYDIGYLHSLWLPVTRHEFLQAGRFW